MEMTSSPVVMTTYFDDYDYEQYDYTEFMYTVFSFELQVYLYVWEILVIFMFLINIVVIYILLRRKMRNPTHMILVAIAISDSLTGLVTLPTYIMAYRSYEPGYTYNDHDNQSTRSTVQPNYSDTTDQYENYASSTAYVSNNYFSYGLESSSNENRMNSSSGGSNNTFVFANKTHDEMYYDMYPSGPYELPEGGPEEGIALSENLCEWFMISKYFLSKSLHTVSIFLTLFLAIQRYICVAYPFWSQSIFSTRKIIICCVAIFVLSPTLHSYHLSKERAVEGNCVWELEAGGCKGECIFLWLLFFVRHFIPCFALTTFTTLFIKNLQRGTANLRRMDTNASQLSQRREENRRISLIVIAVVVVFLVPEIPYGAFLCYSAIYKTAYNAIGMSLENNRVILMIYELSLLLSFHANFYIYTFLNRRFRRCLYKTFVQPVQRVLGKRKFSIATATSTGSRKTRRTDYISTQEQIELKQVIKTGTVTTVSGANLKEFEQTTSKEISNGCKNSNSTETNGCNSQI